MEEFDNKETEVQQQGGNLSGLDLDLLSMLSVLSQKIIYIVLIVAVVTVATFCVSKFFVTPMYSAETKLLISNNLESLPTSQGDISAATALAQDCQQVLVSDTILNAVCDRLDYNITSDQIRGKITTEIMTDSRVIKVTVKDSNPLRASKIAEAISSISSADDGGLRIITNVQEVKVIEEATVPSMPYAPNIKQYVLLAALASFVIACFMFILSDKLNDKLKTPEDAEKYLGINILGIIPAASLKKKGKREPEQGGEQ